MIFRFLYHLHSCVLKVPEGQLKPKQAAIMMEVVVGVVGWQLVVRKRGESNVDSECDAWAQVWNWPSDIGVRSADFQHANSRMQVHVQVQPQCSQRWSRLLAAVAGSAQSSGKLNNRCDQVYECAVKNRSIEKHAPSMARHCFLQ